ncbi:protein-export chaperone SecB [Devosia sp. BK]|jgi:preprotein translocase subunit SecB|uniref:protein-export chaperone SecB n=1 Tax=unclassified Devosia TaxID=196773 RepID=UPI0007140C17|nr:MULTISPECIES: protein-export chaperone SecB [unclassified Devosia]KQN73676.1 preprotein translocase subunit SecB [Devosia sp. Leaf64]KQT48305.1 preprotein translocase subunit SecB [Devosia sp. Leaf420]MDV3252370.1 protein-export chaperone SecB [Devosia sp. BK]
MADENQGAAAPQPGNAPSMNLVGQYVRDLSFENPGAPGTIMAGGGNPAFNVSISVGVKKQSDDLYAVELNLKAKANREETLLFNVELVYGGVFRLRNIPEAQISTLLMVECPRLIFPFARQVLANVTQQGGFPPLMMEPVDFMAIYRQNLAQLAAKQQAEGGAAAAPASDLPN